MNGIPGLREAAMRNLHLNDESGSRLRFLPLLVLTELRWYFINRSNFLLKCIYHLLRHHARIYFIGTRFGSNRVVVADMEGIGDFDFWEIYLARFSEKLVCSEKTTSFHKWVANKENEV